MTVTAPSSTPTTHAFEGLTPGVYRIDPGHSEVGFTVRHLMSKVRGQFTQFEGTIAISEDPWTSGVEAAIDLSSVDTRNPDRDRHLRSSDFFSVEQYPTMTFRSTGLRQDDSGIVATGDLTIRDISRPVDLRLDYLGAGSDPYGALRIGFEGTTTISRKEWGINFNIPVDGDKVLIGDKISVVIAVEAVRQSG